MIIVEQDLCHETQLLCWIVQDVQDTLQSDQLIRLHHQCCHQWALILRVHFDVNLDCPPIVKLHTWTFN